MSNTKKKTETRTADTSLHKYDCGCVDSQYYGVYVKYCFTHRKCFSTHGNMRRDIASAAS